VAGVIAAGEPMTGERAVFGTPEDVAGQLRRYADAVDWALLYPPHFGVDPERIHANELSLIEVASGWPSLHGAPYRRSRPTTDRATPGASIRDFRPGQICDTLFTSTVEVKH